MKTDKNKIYKLNISQQQRKDLGFHYDIQLQEYVYEFPVYKYNNKPIIICKLGIDEETNIIWFNVYDANGGLYTPYYNNEYGKNEILPIINNNIKKEFIKLKILKVGDSNKYYKSK